MIKSSIVCVFVIVIVMLNGCSGCVQSNYKQIASPDGNNVLIEREINCSALDPHGTLLSIQSSQPRFGIKFLGFTHKTIFAADVPLNKTQIKWLDIHNIEVICTGCEKYGIATKVETWNNIRVHFTVGNAGKGSF